MRLEELAIIAKSFREAFETIGRACTFGFFHQFPEDCCTWGSEFIGNFLISEYGLNPQCVTCTAPGGKHQWTEYDNIIIDITADQFSETLSSVIVTTKSTWHAELENREESAYKPISRYSCIHEGEKLLDIYDKITAKVRDSI